MQPTFSSTKFLEEVKLRDSCSFSVSRYLIFSADVSLYYKLHKQMSAVQFIIM